ncbi:MAG: hypothetical protein ACYSX0_04740 [Planctomycetota bacterium]
MSRLLAAMLLLSGGLLLSQEDQPERRLLRANLKTGARYAGSNTVSATVKTVVRKGDQETSSSYEISRTERFVDEVLRAGENGVTEIRRHYLRCFAKEKDSEKGRPKVHQSAVQGHTILIREKRRRRDIEFEGKVAMDLLLRKVVGMEMDWRDIFSDEPVAPGESWEGDATALTRRLAPYLECGTRPKMKVHYEEILKQGDREIAKLYVDWVIQGMRDKHLFTKVVLAGDVLFDFKLERVVSVDLAGSIIVRGAIVGQDAPRIVKGEGPVSVKSEIKEAPLQAAADGEDTQTGSGGKDGQPESGGDTK